MESVEQLVHGTDPCAAAREELAAVQAETRPYFAAHRLELGEAAKPDIVPTELQERIVAAERRLAECERLHIAPS